MNICPSDQSEVAGCNSKTTRTNVIRAFCERIQQAGYIAGVYASESWLKEMINVDQLPYRFWIANYSKKPTYHDYDGWQRTSTAKVNGISTNVDVSEWFSERVIFDPATGLSYEESYYGAVTPAKEEPVIEEPAAVSKPVPFGGSDWSKEARDWAVAKQIVKGETTPDEIDWSATVTLERLVTILHRYLVL